MQTDLVSLDDLRADPRNPKDHAVEELCASIERFGFAEPVILDERTGLLLAGHGRAEALRAMRLAGKAAPAGIVVEPRVGERGPFDAWLVPTVRGFATSDDDEAAAFLVAANQLSTLGGWDDVALRRLLHADVDLTGTGFSPRDVKALARSAPLPRDQAHVKVIDASVAGLVVYATCPHCQHRFPK